MRAGLPRFRERSPIPSHLVSRQAIDIGEALLDEDDGKVIEPLEIVGGEKHVVAPVESKPADIFLNRLYVFRIFRRRVRIIHAEMTDPARLLAGNAEVEADRLGMPDMEIAVGFRRKTSDHPAAMFACGTIGRNQFTNEV